MNRHIALVVITALSGLPTVAAAAETAVDAPVAQTSAALATPGAHFVLVDAEGRTVGELVSERSDRLRLRLIGISAAGRSVPAPTDARADRTFHPDFSRALSPGQMSSAWQAELDRLFPTVPSGE